MTMSVRALKNSRNLNAALRGATVEDVDTIISALQSIKETKEIEEFEAKQREIEFKERINKALNFLNENNISLEELIDGKSATVKKKKMEPKYHYIDLEGNDCFWTGQGKFPTAFKALLEQTGQTKEHFLIVRSENN